MHFKCLEKVYSCFGNSFIIFEVGWSCKTGITDARSEGIISSVGIPDNDVLINSSKVCQFLNNPIVIDSQELRFHRSLNKGSVHCADRTIWSSCELISSPDLGLEP